MKTINSIPKSGSEIWIASVLIILAFFAIAVMSPTTVMAAKEKGPNKCTDLVDNDGDDLIDEEDPDCGGDGGDGGTDGPDPYNLARASFLPLAGSGSGGISADGEDFCVVDRGAGGGGLVT